MIHQENGGVSSARNVGITAATGKYIGFVDADDWIVPEMFQNLLSIATEKDCDLVMCDARTVYADGHSKEDTISQLKNSCMLSREGIPPNLLLEMAGSVWRCLYRAEMLRRFTVKFPIGIKFSEDRIFNILSIGYSNTVAYEKVAYYQRFINSDSAVHRFHSDYFEAYLAAAATIENAITIAWGDDDALQTAYLRQLISGALSAICNYYYKTSSLNCAERKDAVRRLCRNVELRTAIERTGSTDIRAKWIEHQNISMLILYARLANLKHGR